MDSQSTDGQIYTSPVRSKMHAVDLWGTSSATHEAATPDLMIDDPMDAYSLKDVSTTSRRKVRKPLKRRANLKARSPKPTGDVNATPTLRKKEDSCYAYSASYDPEECLSQRQRRTNPVP